MSFVGFVDSTVASRVYWAHKESRRPMPQFSEDDVLDFMVLEALTSRAAVEQRDAEKQQERKRWMSPESTKAWAKDAGVI